MDEELFAIAEVEDEIPTGFGVEHVAQDSVSLAVAENEAGRGVRHDYFCDGFLTISWKGKNEQNGELLHN